MAKKPDGSLSVKDAVYRLQNYLLDGITDEAQLFAAGSIMSRSDYEDVVTERSIANLCGYPLCSNSLPSDRPRKGRYRISLKEHKVYDLHETHIYCSSGCVVHSRAFAGSLQEERGSALNPTKLDEVLRLFEGLGSEKKEDGDFGISKLKIQEKEEVKSGDVSMEQWAGPSNAIEGYVPQRERKPAHFRQKARKEGLRPSNAKPDKSNLIINDFDFVSSIITSDEYSVSKLPPSSTGTASSSRLKGLEGGESMKADSRDESGQKNKVSDKKSSKSKRQSMSICTEDAPSTSNTWQPSSVKSVSESGGTLDAEKIDGKSSSNGLKSSLKSRDAKKVNHSVTWADKKDEHPRNGNLCDVREMEDREAVPATSGDACIEDEEDLLRFCSAEACAMALNDAAEAVAAGECDVSDAVSDAGLIILPPAHDVEEEVPLEDLETVEVDLASIKWPRQTTIPTSDMFDSEDSWFDVPPEGFSLTLSPFATMWGALFSWVTSSSIAYIYGQDESFQENYLSVNGREYPQKIVLSDGLSSEIKQTLAGCLARALPGLVADLRLPIPISTLEQGLGRLLDTMSFRDSLPSFRAKQWQVVLLLFMDALSVSRVSALTPHMTNRRALLHKVLDGAQIGVDQYEIMKDLLIPLGRAPRFSAQSGA